MQTIIENRRLVGLLRPALLGIVLIPLAASISCQSNQSSNDRASDGNALFGTSAPAQSESAWSIVIVSYKLVTGTTLRELEKQAQLDLDRVRGVGLTDAYVQIRGERFVLAFGKYDSADDPAALADLHRVKSIEWQGINPFAGALLAPPANISLGDQPEYNLANIKQRFGQNAIYSLLIGEYGHPDKSRPTESDRRQFRKAAEEGVLQLRREGEQAFYHHGASSSSITVGVFGHEDYRIEIDGKGRKDTIRSRRLDAAFARFPKLLLNGKTIKLTALSKPGKPVLQSTDLIRIP